MGEVVYAAKERQRVAVTGPARLANNAELDPYYDAEDGELVEWVVEKGRKLYADRQVAVDEVEPRGERG